MNKGILIYTVREQSQKTVTKITPVKLFTSLHLTLLQKQTNGGVVKCSLQERYMKLLQADGFMVLFNLLL